MVCGETSAAVTGGDRHFKSPSRLLNAAFDDNQPVYSQITSVKNRFRRSWRVLSTLSRYARGNNKLS